MAAFTLGSAQLLFAANVVTALARRRAVEANPWRAATLEWATTSPPPHDNFAEVPTVHRWPYEYGVTSATDVTCATDPDTDFLRQDVAADGASAQPKVGGDLVAVSVGGAS